MVFPTLFFSQWTPKSPLNQEWKAVEISISSQSDQSVRTSKQMISFFRFIYNLIFFHIFFNNVYPKCRKSQNEIHNYEKNIHMLGLDQIQTVENNS